jgi:hypothetical protein
LCAQRSARIAWEKIGALRADIWSVDIGNRKYEILVIESGNFASKFEYHRSRLNTSVAPAPPSAEPVPPPEDEKRNIIPFQLQMPLKYKIASISH